MDLLKKLCKSQQSTALSAHKSIIINKRAMTIEKKKSKFIKLEKYNLTHFLFNERTALSKFHVKKSKMVWNFFHWFNYFGFVDNLSLLNFKKSNSEPMKWQKKHKNIGDCITSVSLIWYVHRTVFFFSISMRQ